MKSYLYKRLVIAASFAIAGTTMAPAQHFRHVANEVELAQQNTLFMEEQAATTDSIEELTADRILETIQLPMLNRLLRGADLSPMIFTGFRGWKDKFHYSFDRNNPLTQEIWDAAVRDTLPTLFWTEEERELLYPQIETDSAFTDFIAPALIAEREFPEVADLPDFITRHGVPAWLEESLAQWHAYNDMRYSLMLMDPRYISVTYWSLPEPPHLPEEDYSFSTYLRQLDLPGIPVAEKMDADIEIEKRHWLHIFNIGVQFSQAYLSENWYQGGNNYLSLLGNFLWDVQLNQVWHPNLIFQSTLSYKLGLNRNANESYDSKRYTISEDLFQYNLRAGIKAFRHWFYSFSTQFKTQLLNNYTISGDGNEVRQASFLTPSELNLGIGMTYNYQNKKKTLQFNASIAPLSYNLKTAIDPNVNHMLYNIPQTAKCVSEIGSNAEVTFDWKMGTNIHYKTRLFLFSDYKYFLGDWQNTLEFQFNKFFSTQIYANLRYDSSSDSSISPKWHKWMLKEILSVGLSYTFSTKQ